MEELRTTHRRDGVGGWVPVGDHWEWVPGGAASVVPAVPETVDCDECGECVPVLSSRFVESRERVVCESCSFTCEWCDAVELRSSADRVGEYEVCRGCARQLVECADCDTVFDPDYQGSDVAGYSLRSRWVCQTCLDRYSYCGSCETYDRDRATCDDCQHCQSCCECAPDDWHEVNLAGGLLPYDFRPSVFSFFTLDAADCYEGDEYRDPATLFVGLEVETERMGEESRADLVRFVSGALGPVAYVKHDGSLEEGLEVVTHPMTPDYFAQCADFDRAMRGLADRGARSWGSHRCGFHVHLTRSAFVSRAHLFAFSLFWYRNRMVVQKISGRSDYQLDRWASLSAHQGTQEWGHPRLIDKVNRRGGQTRYAAVNLSNADTVEVRVFRATLRPERLRGYVEFVVAVFDYTSALTSHDIRAGFLGWDRFTHYLDHVQFPHVAGLLAARGVN